MSNPTSTIFAITVPASTVRLDASRRGTTTFTATNTSNRPIQAVARILPQNAAAAQWLSLADAGPAELAVGATRQYSVSIAAPLTAPTGSYTFQLVLAEKDNPDDNYSVSQSVTFEVSPAPVRRPFPWWIVIAAVVAVLIIGSIAVYFISSGNNKNTDTSNSATIQANAVLTALAQINSTATAQANNTQTAIAQLNSSQQTAIANQTGTAGAQATGTANVQNAVNTALAYITATKAQQDTIAAAQNISTQTAAAYAAQTQAAIDIFNGKQYTGSWLNDSATIANQYTYFTQIDIATAANRTLTVHVVNAAGNDLGTQTVAYTGANPVLSLTIPVSLGGFGTIPLTDVLTLQLAKNNAQLVVTDNYGTTTYHRKPLKISGTVLDPNIIRDMLTQKP